MTVEEQMDEARIPYAAQRKSLPSYAGCEDVRGYIDTVREQEPVGVNFLLANDFNQATTRLSPHDARTMLWVFVKELILSNRTVKVMNPSNLAEMLCSVKPWEEEFAPDYADHLILTNFFRAGQPSPYTPRELNRLVDYVGERYEYDKTTHCFWEVYAARGIITDAQEWYPQLWLEWWLDENLKFWIGRK